MVPRNAIPNVYWANFLLWGPVAAEEDTLYRKGYVPVTVVR
jgi:hypothetical protein